MKTPQFNLHAEAKNTYRTAGGLDVAARIYRNAVVVPCYVPAIRERLQKEYGGSIEGHRLIIRGIKPRKKLLNAWLNFTRDREIEIRAELHRLEHLNDKEQEA